MWIFFILKFLGRVFVIIEYLFDVVVEKNLFVEFICRVLGFLEFKIFWYCNGVEILIERWRLMLFDGNFYFIWIVLSKCKIDSGIYSCKVKNWFGIVYSKNVLFFIGSEWFFSNNKDMMIMMLSYWK